MNQLLDTGYWGWNPYVGIVRKYGLWLMGLYGDDDVLWRCDFAFTLCVLFSFCLFLFLDFEVCLDDNIFVCLVFTLKCRQKTRDFAVSCKNMKKGKPCPINFCHKCLLNRLGSLIQMLSFLFSELLYLVKHILGHVYGKDFLALQECPKIYCFATSIQSPNNM